MVGGGSEVRPLDQREGRLILLAQWMLRISLELHDDKNHKATIIDCLYIHEN